MKQKPPKTKGDGDTFAKNQSTLATMLGVSRAVVSFWAGRQDAPKKTPKGFDVMAWRSYLNANCQAGTAPDLRHLRAKKMQLEIELLQIEKDQQAGRLIAVAEIAASAETSNRLMSAAVQQHLVEELPPHIAGQDVIACREMLQRVAEKILRGYTESLDRLLVTVHGSNASNL